MFKNIFPKNNNKSIKKVKVDSGNEDFLDSLPKRTAANLARDMEYEKNNSDISIDSDPMKQLEKIIKSTAPDVLRKIIESVDDSDLSVASYYLKDEDKKTIYNIVGEKEAAAIKEDQYFMGDPALCDVRETCKIIMAVADKVLEEK